MIYTFKNINERILLFEHWFAYCWISKTTFFKLSLKSCVYNLFLFLHKLFLPWKTNERMLFIWAFIRLLWNFQYYFYRKNINEQILLFEHWFVYCCITITKMYILTFVYILHWKYKRTNTLIGALIRFTSKHYFYPEKYE